VATGAVEAWPVEAEGAAADALAVAELVGECFGNETDVGLDPQPAITIPMAARTARDPPFILRRILGLWEALAEGGDRFGQSCLQRGLRVPADQLAGAGEIRPALFRIRLICHGAHAQDRVLESSSCSTSDRWS
jgi:hypothetical protein